MTRPIALCALLTLLPGVVTPIRAQPMELDASFAPRVDYAPSGIAAARYISAPNRHLIVVGGRALFVNDVHMPHGLARLLVDGSIDPTFVPKLHESSLEVVREAVALPDSRVLALTEYDPVLTPGLFRLVRLLSDGQIDPTFAPKYLSGPTSSRLGLSLLSDGSAIVWGSFSHIGQTELNGLARVLSDGTVDLSFAPNLTDGLNVESLVVTPDDRLVFSGVAYPKEGSSRYYFNRLTLTGAIDPSFLPSTPSRTFTIATALSDHSLILSDLGLRRVRADGTDDAAFAEQTSQLKIIRSIVRLPDDRLAVEAAIDPPASDGISSVFVLKRDGSVELDCRTLPGAERIQFLGTARSDGSLAVVQGPLIWELAPLSEGSEWYLPGMAEPQLVLVEVGAKTLASLPTTIDAINRGTVNRLSLDASGRVIVEGHFTRIAGLRRPGLARFNLDGTIDPTYDPPAVFPLFHLPDGRIIGLRRTLGTSGAHGFHPYLTDVVRLSPNGILDPTFAPTDDLDLVTASWLAADVDGRILVCAFEGGAAQESNAKLVWLAEDGSRNTTLSTTFAGFLARLPSVTYPWAVQTAAALPDGKILLRPLARTVNGQPAALLVRLNADGSTDGSYRPSVSSQMVNITNAKPLPDGRAFVFGTKAGIVNFEQNATLRLNPDGSPDTFVETALAAGVPLGDGSYLYGSDRFHPNGTRDLNYSFPRLSDDLGYGLRSAVLTSDGRIWIGAEFSRRNPKHIHEPPAGLVRLAPLETSGFTVQPLSAVSYAGFPATLQAELGTAAPATFQWTHHGTPIPGATDRSLKIPRTRASDAGEYRLVATIGNTTHTSEPAVLTVRANDARLVNFSARSRVAAGAIPQICGFVLRTPSPRPILLRALGQGLPADGLGELLPRPVLRLHRNGVFLAEDAGSALHPSIVEIFPRIGATPSRPMYPADGSANATATHDSALFSAYPEGAYTAHTLSGDDQSGVSLFELYDAGAADDTALSSAVKNVSIRARTAPGDDVLIAGFVIAGTTPTRVLIRGLGPALAQAGVTDTVADPQISLYAGDRRVALNDQWTDQADVPDIVAATARVGATALPIDSREAVLFVTLNPGVYTVHGSGIGGSTGEMMIELFVGEE